MWNKAQRIVVEDHLPLAAEVRTRITRGRGENGRILVLIRKQVAVGI